MSRKATLTAINALPHVHARYLSDTGEYRIHLTDVAPRMQEAGACYTDDAADALATAGCMSREAALKAAWRADPALSASLTLADKLAALQAARTGKPASVEA